MKFFIMLSRRSLGIILAVLIIAFLLTMQTFSQKASRIDGSTNEIRVNYLKGLKLYVYDDSVQSKEIVIPTEFGDVYDNYNRLQKESGFDLSKYKGKPATVYTYPLDKNSNVHLIVYGGQIIGGDIADVNIDGEIKPLITS